MIFFKMKKGEKSTKKIGGKSEKNTDKKELGWNVLRRAARFDLLIQAPPGGGGSRGLTTITTNWTCA